MRTLRSVLNKAMKEKLIKRDHYPFDEYVLSDRLNTETQKRAIVKDKVKAIEALQLEEHSPEQFAKDIFLFSYYTRGMSFIDIAYLTLDNIINDRINYIRKKTKKPLSIKLLPQANEILNYYIFNKGHQGRFIFPIFDESIHITPKQKYDRRKTALRKVNRSFKKHC